MAEPRRISAYALTAVIVVFIFYSLMNSWATNDVTTLSAAPCDNIHKVRLCYLSHVHYLCINRLISYIMLAAYCVLNPATCIKICLILLLRHC